MPNRFQNAAPVAPTGDDKEIARHGTSGIARPASSRLPSVQGDPENRRSLLWVEPERVRDLAKTNLPPI